MKKSTLPDAFKEPRENDGTLVYNDQNDPVRMILGHKDVRKAAHNWKLFQSGAKPGRIVVPSEVNIRDIRQIPFEVDPPEHKGFRALVEPWFKRPEAPEYQARLKPIIEGCLDEALAKGSLEVVHDFALKLQSRALTILLNTDPSQGELFISWGTHVFRSADDPLDASKANVLFDFLDAEIAKAHENPGEDLISVLLASDVEGRKLTDEEVKGVMMLTFAGGRDTVINAVTNTIAYFADHPASMEKMRNEPEKLNQAVEELVRYFSPLTQMGRVATEDTAVCEHAVKADTRISMCWASANRDERVFENPNEVDLDREVNPHVGFGFGVHNCLGATHARTILRMLITLLVEKVHDMEIVDCEKNMEDLDDVQRQVGFHKLNVKFNAR